MKIDTVFKTFWFPYLHLCWSVTEMQNDHTLTCRSEVTGKPYIAEEL